MPCCWSRGKIARKLHGLWDARETLALSGPQARRKLALSTNEGPEIDREQRCLQGRTEADAQHKATENLNPFKKGLDNGWIDM